jgi:hypothetical protein
MIKINVINQILSKKSIALKKSTKQRNPIKKSIAANMVTIFSEIKF